MNLGRHFSDLAVLFTVRFLSDKEGCSLALAVVRRRITVNVKQLILHVLNVFMKCSQRYSEVLRGYQRFSEVLRGSRFSEIQRFQRE